MIMLQIIYRLCRNVKRHIHAIWGDNNVAFKRKELACQLPIRQNISRYLSYYLWPVNVGFEWKATLACAFQRGG